MLSAEFQTQPSPRGRHHSTGAPPPHLPLTHRSSPLTRKHTRSSLGRYLLDPGEVGQKAKLPLRGLSFALVHGLGMDPGAGSAFRRCGRVGRHSMVRLFKNNRMRPANPS